MGCSCELRLEFSPEFKARAEAALIEMDLLPEDGLRESKNTKICYLFENLHSSMPDVIRAKLKNAGIHCMTAVRYSDYEPEFSLLEPQEGGEHVIDVTMSEIESAVNFERFCLIKLIEQRVSMEKLLAYLKENTNQRFANFHRYDPSESALLNAMANSNLSAMHQEGISFASSFAEFDCEECRKEAGALRTWMILCPNCGNKRCPQALNHRHQCTGSNESGQTGINKETNL